MATPKKKPKPKLREDVNTMAARIVAEATGLVEKTPDPDAGKDPAAVKRGRAGGLKGGKTRAAKLSKKQKVATAKRAAVTRWNGI